jgi:hypothetical protein
VGTPSGDIIPVEIAVIPSLGLIVPPHPLDWVPASVLQNKFVLLDIDPSAHPSGYPYCIQWAHLWIRITVERCDTACEYSGGGQLFVQLDAQKPWVDPDTGSWGPGFP